jgi:hypothetical protein
MAAADSPAMNIVRFASNRDGRKSFSRHTGGLPPNSPEAGDS